MSAPLFLSLDKLHIGPSLVNRQNAAYSFRLHFFIDCRAEVNNHEGDQAEEPSSFALMRLNGWIQGSTRTLRNTDNGLIESPSDWAANHPIVKFWHDFCEYMHDQSHSIDTIHKSYSKYKNYWVTFKKEAEQYSGVGDAVYGEKNTTLTFTVKDVERDVYVSVSDDNFESIMMRDRIWLKTFQSFIPQYSLIRNGKALPDFLAGRCIDLSSTLRSKVVLYEVTSREELTKDNFIELTKASISAELRSSMIEYGVLGGVLKNELLSSVEPLNRLLQKQQREREASKAAQDRSRDSLEMIKKWMEAREALQDSRGVPDVPESDTRMLEAPTQRKRRAREPEPESNAQAPEPPRRQRIRVR